VAGHKGRPDRAALFFDDTLEVEMMQKDLPSICVIGGGFTGVAAAIACLSRFERPFRLTIVEPDVTLGRGVAFGGHHPMHLLNVRARDLSVFADRPRDFLNWAFRQLDQGENDAGLLEGLGHTFLPRQMFGEYVRQRLFETAKGRPDVEFDIVNSRADSCRHTDSRFIVEIQGAGAIAADIVVVATAYGLPDSSTAGALAPFAFVPAEDFSKAGSIALIGSGLTMVDVLLNARREGFSGTATVISRWGQLPREHAPKGVVPKEMALPRTKRLSRLTASIRIACEAAEAHGTPWQAVFNGLRPLLQAMWQELEIKEQSRFLRHVRPFWDAHRHRLPGEVHERIQSEFNEGRAVLLRGRVVSVDRRSDGFALTLNRRGSVETFRVDLAFDCSGHKPDVESPLIKSLIGKGLARLDKHALGLAAQPDGRVLGGNGGPTLGLFALGPLCQGSLWEITAVPEIVRQADFAATCISANYSRTSRMSA
jgi:uncharacterized NAD(P)/FAD-binding protein YdhS